jgi:hypothetical protein
MHVARDHNGYVNMVIYLFIYYEFKNLCLHHLI